MSNPKIPVSVLVATKNEEKMIVRCLRSLQDFDDVIVVDSKSEDKTALLAEKYGAQVIPFKWNGCYPKKRQWCLNTLELKHNWVFFVDADEELPKALIDEVRDLNFSVAGYFVKGANVINGKVLRHGLHNKKLCLFDKNKIEFPVVDDLDIVGMGEIEGHYQPTLKVGFEKEEIGQLNTPLCHHTFEDFERWQKSHDRYALWEREMIKRKAYPKDPILWRERLKSTFRVLPLRGLLMFFYAYVWKLGFLEGVHGFRVARLKAQYYFKI